MLSPSSLSRLRWRLHETSERDSNRPIFTCCSVTNTALLRVLLIFACITKKRAAEFIVAHLARARLLPLLFTWWNNLSRLRCRFQSRVWSHPLQRTRAKRPSYYLSTINDCDFKLCPRLRPRGEAGIQWLLPRLTHATFFGCLSWWKAKVHDLVWGMLHWRGSLADACSLTRGISTAHKRWRMIDLRACMVFFGRRSNSSKPVVPGPGGTPTLHVLHVSWIKHTWFRSSAH